MTGVKLVKRSLFIIYWLFLLCLSHHIGYKKGREHALRSYYPLAVELSHVVGKQNRLCITECHTDLRCKENVMP